MTTTLTNILTVNNTATGAIRGAGIGVGSYINGPVKWSLAAGANNYLFPVGSGTCTAVNLPFTLNKAASSAVTATVQAFASASGGIVDGTMSTLTPSAYWKIASVHQKQPFPKVAISIFFVSPINLFFTYTKRIYIDLITVCAN
ncbi:MAG: hypothetical protein WDM71_08410 [Ferruginibacter sp.]